MAQEGAPVTGVFAGLEANDLALTHTFTLFVTAGDWDNAGSMPGGTDIASTVLNVTIRDDQQDLVFTSTALKDAFNTAVGGTLYLGIRSDGETLTPSATDRSFKSFSHSEDTTGGPDLDYTPVPEPGSENHKNNGSTKDQHCFCHAMEKSVSIRGEGYRFRSHGQGRGNRMSDLQSLCFPYPLLTRNPPELLGACRS